MASFVKEELGRVPGRLVVSAVQDEKVIWQKETDLVGLEAAKDQASKLLNQLQRKAANP